MANFIPTINVKGIYTLKEPFNTSLLAGVLYTPVSLRSVASIVADGKDPYELFYHPKGISQDDYQKDVQDGVLIVTFRADDGNFVDVPSSFITGQPIIGGVVYRSMMFAVPLSPLPDTLDLTFIQQRISDVVFDTLGIRVDVKPVVASPPTVLTQDEHAATEAARKLNITTNQTDLAKYLQAAKERDDALEQVRLRDEWILRNKPA